MQPRKIFESDLQLIQSAFFKSIVAGVVYNPEEDIVQNADGDLIFIKSEDELKTVAKTAKDVLLFIVTDEIPPVNYDEFAGIVSMYKIKTRALKEGTISYLQGNYNTIRFAFTNALKTPLFYRIKGDKYEYPQYKQVTDKALLKMGMSFLVASPKFFTYSKKETLDLVAAPAFTYAEEYVFTKQATIFETDNVDIIKVRKICDSDYAREINNKEERILRGLADVVSSSKISFPQVIENEHHLVLTNNYPANAEMTDQLEDLHIEALDEFYKSNKGVKKVGELFDENNYLQMIKAFKLILSENLQPNGISPQHIEDLGVDLITLMNRMDTNEPVFTSIFHGAFEPANCLKANSRLHLNNFGKYETDKPLLFDAFHYIFYRIEQAQMPSMGELDDVMKHLFKNKSLIKTIEEHSINFKLNLALFHLHHIIYKIEGFLKQRFINPNVNFTLTFYKQALERMNSIKLQ
ncbi:MAG: hypothetical protein ACPGLV_02930 [Bacteroidia bacterium]